MVNENASIQVHWTKSTPAISVYVIVIATVINQGLGNLGPFRYDPYTGKQAERRAKTVDDKLAKLDDKLAKLEAQQQLDRDMLRKYCDATMEATSAELRKYSDINAERTSSGIYLHLAQNYLTKDEIPPDRVESALDRLEKWRSSHEQRFINHDERIQGLSDRMTRCCYKFEAPNANRSDFNALESKN